ncbi:MULTISPECIES: BtpA/SgcQ family protein [Salinibaculum]|uniref:BtpA/SgcQ family protein n=1 Tax=Salinibaculum TaxID=2732368 RepID=UPI0030CD52F5
MDLQSRFGSASPVVGMVHLPALPGAPQFGGSREHIHDRALGDATTLADGGVDAVLVENFGDAPFYPETVPDHVVAEMTAATGAVGDAVDCPHGVNVLRNDAGAALSVAAASGGAFVRVNVHTGTRVTDQGVLDGQAHETLRQRERIDADVAILADVAVKHSAPIAERDVGELATETIDRGLADGLVVSGPATGARTETDELRTVLDARDDVDADVPVLVGSGVTPENAADLLALADGLIVGTALKEGGATREPVDPERVERLVAAAGER